MKNMNMTVEFNREFGPPTNLAHNLHMHIMQAAFKQKPPVQEVFRVGTMTDIARTLGLSPSGWNCDRVKKALCQLMYTRVEMKTEGRDKNEVLLGVLYYDVIPEGRQLPDGTIADAVHVKFNKPYLEDLKPMLGNS